MLLHFGKSNPFVRLKKYCGSNGEDDINNSLYKILSKGNHAISFLLLLTAPAWHMHSITV